jgi:hypothetical protein
MMMKIMAESSSSSSDASLSQEGEKAWSRESEHDGLLLWCVDQASLLFAIFKDNPAIPRRVVNLCRKYGSEAVALALREATWKIEAGRRVNWRFVEKVAENQHNEGGAVGMSLDARQLERAEQKDKEETEAWMKAKGFHS